jgi:hypothetical protein
MYSDVVFAAAPGKEDGLLEAREIMDLDLHADLAVLSACESGRGHLGAGEGIIGLTWAFFVAGCPATVASQWKVESRARRSRCSSSIAGGMRARIKARALTAGVLEGGPQRQVQAPVLLGRLRGDGRPALSAGRLPDEEVVAKPTDGRRRHRRSCSTLSSRPSLRAWRLPG